MPEAAAPGLRAWVVFTGKTELKRLRWLKRGFRHCYLLFHDGRGWYSFDPLAHCTEFAVHSQLEAGFDLPLWLARRGLTVVPAAIETPPPRPAPLMPFTCVEAVKRLLGIRDRRVFTPWRLYRYLSARAL